MKTQEKNIKEREESPKEGALTRVTMSVKDVATRLSVSEETVRRWCRAGELGHYKIGNTIRILEGDLTQYIKGLYNPRVTRG